MRVVVVLAVLCRVAYATPAGTAEELPPPPRAPVAAPPVAPDPPPSPDEPRVESYRAQTLLADALAGALMFAAFNSHDDDRAQALAKLSMSAYVLGGPIVHLSKNRGKRALASITLRIGFPILGSIIGDSMKPDDGCGPYYACEGPSLDEPTEEQLLGALIGVVAASTIDTLYLAKGDPPPPARAAWAPTARLTHGGVALGVRGSF